MHTNFILFDFDGVIVDSFATAFEVKKMICPNATEADYKKGFEGNINDWQKADTKHDEKCRHDIDFFAEYIPRIKERVLTIPGIEKVIKELAKSYTLIVISSTLTAPIQGLLEKYNLAPFFVEVMGNDVHTSKVEKMKMVFSKYNIDSNKCVFITDTLGDMREAKHVKMGSIGVTWGFHDRETLIRGEPFKIVEKPEDLVTTVSEYFKK